MVRPFIERCTLLLTGVEELAEVLGPAATEWTGGARPLSLARAEHHARAVETDGRAEALARAAAALGPAEVVVRGASTIGALAQGVWHELAITRGAAVDPIGAGDAFNAGYIADRLRGLAVADALQTGVRCGTAVTTAISDTAGFPRNLNV